VDPRKSGIRALHPSLETNNECTVIGAECDCTQRCAARYAADAADSAMVAGMQSAHHKEAGLQGRPWPRIGPRHYREQLRWTVYIQWSKQGLTCGFIDRQRHPSTLDSGSQGGSAGSNPVGVHAKRVLTGGNAGQGLFGFLPNGTAFEGGSADRRVERHISANVALTSANDFRGASAGFAGDPARKRVQLVSVPCVCPSWVPARACDVQLS
jgi:hypothetical protein